MDTDKERSNIRRRTVLKSIGLGSGLATTPVLGVAASGDDEVTIPAARRGMMVTKSSVFS